MKALELLQRNLINMAIANPMERLGISGYELKEAIAELEEAMKPKSCEGCRWKYEPYSENLPCCSCDRSVGIDYYELKETK